LFFHTEKMMGGANLFKVIPELLAIVADTNPGEVRATFINLWSPNELLSIVFLLVCGALCWTLSRVQPNVHADQALAVVSMAALVALLITPDFILHKTYAGVDESWKVYSDNLERIEKKEAFRWRAKAGYPGRDTVVLVL